MVHRAKLLLMFSILGVLSDRALSRTAPPPPYDPFRIAAETIAYVKIVQVGSATEYRQSFNVRNIRVIRGRPIPPKLSINLDRYCVLENVSVVVGAEYIVYLHPRTGSSDWYACTFVNKDDAIPRDPFVAAAFINGDAGKRAAAADRAEEVFRFEGPVPSIPIDQWPDQLTGELTLRWIDAVKRQDLFRTRVRFKVGDDGRVEDCSNLMAGGGLSRTEGDAINRLCSWLKKVAQFKPPMFPMERKGSMFWAWPPSQ